MWASSKRPERLSRAWESDTSLRIFSGAILGPIPIAEQEERAAMDPIGLVA
jgi:hypothetical protein